MVCLLGSPRLRNRRWAHRLRSGWHGVVGDCDNDRRVNCHFTRVSPMQNHPSKACTSEQCPRGLRRLKLVFDHRKFTNKDMAG